MKINKKIISETIDRFLEKGENGIWVLDSGIPGPVVTINALMHANEPSGLFAIDNLFIKQGIKPLKGKIQLMIGNYKAALNWDDSKNDCNRYIDSDLNRVWDFDKDNFETKRAKEMVPFLMETDYLMDIHSTTQPSRPMIIPYPKKESVDYCKDFVADYMITNILDYLKGKPMVSYFIEDINKDNSISFAIEVGQHFDEESVNIAEDNIMILLQKTGVYKYSLVSKKQEMIYLEIFDVIRNKTMDFDIAYSNSPNSFDFIKKDTLIATDGSRKIICPQDCHIIMPVKGKDIDYLDKECGYVARKIN